MAPLAMLHAGETPPPTPGATNVQEIIVVCKTHFDIGYTHRVNDLLDYYRTTMIDRALDVMDDSKELPPEQQSPETLSKTNSSKCNSIRRVARSLHSWRNALAAIGWTRTQNTGSANTSTNGSTRPRPTATAAITSKGGGGIPSIPA